MGESLRSRAINSCFCDLRYRLIYGMTIWVSCSRKDVLEIQSEVMANFMPPCVVSRMDARYKPVFFCAEKKKGSVPEALVMGAG